MHYLNLLTIRLYMLIMTLPDHFPGWLRHGINLSMVRMPFSFPDINDKSFNNQTINNIYQAGGAHREVANFYIHFSNYLQPTRPIYSLIVQLVGHFTDALYDISNDLEDMYIRLFKIFDMVGYGSGHAGKEIMTWYKYIQYLGWAVFMLLLALYAVGMIFNMQGGFARMKNLIVGMLMATSFMFVLPALTQGFVKGIQVTVNTVLRDKNNDSADIITGKDQQSLADGIVRDNVVSLPNATTYAALHNIKYVNTDERYDGNQIFTPSGNYSKSIPTQTYFVNLYHMPNNHSTTDLAQDKDVWNGIGNGSVREFLKSVGSDGSYLDKNTITRNENFLRTNYGNQSFMDGVQLRATQFWNGVLGKDITINPQAREQAQDTINKASYDHDPVTRIFYPYMFHIKGSGDDAQFTTLDQFGGGTSFIQGLHESYRQYQINWWNIILGIGTLIFILLGLIIKLANSFFKMVVMYVTAGWFMMKNASQHDKIKDFIRSFFGIFENLILDMIILRLFVVIYVNITRLISEMPFNPIIIGLVQFFVSIGLFKVESQGIDTLSSQLSGQNNKTGHGLGAIAGVGMAAMGARQLGHGATRATKAGAKGAVKGGAHFGKQFHGGWQRHHNLMHPNDQKKGGLGSKMGQGTGKMTGNTGSSRGQSNGHGGPGVNGHNNPQGSPNSGPPPAHTMAGKAGAMAGFLTRGLAGDIRHRNNPDYFGMLGQGGKPDQNNKTKPHFQGQPNNTKKGNNQAAERMHQRNRQRNTQNRQGTNSTSNNKNNSNNHSPSNHSQSTSQDQTNSDLQSQMDNMPPPDDASGGSQDEGPDDKDHSHRGDDK